MEYRKIKKVRHYVYDNIQEFNISNPDVEVSANWRTANEGDWVHSDDGRIVQLLRVKNEIKHPNDRKNYKFAKGYVRTVVGTFLKRKTTTMDTDFSEHANRYTFSKTIKNPADRVYKREKTTNKEKIFATNVAVGMGPVKAYMDAFNEDKEDTAKKKAAILLKQRRVIREVEKSVMDVAKELGIDHTYVLQSLKLLAESTDDENIALQSLKEMGKAIGTLSGGVKKIETGVMGLFKGFSPDQLEGADTRNLLKEKTNDMSTLHESPSDKVREEDVQVGSKAGL